jgi:triosephosphate isomerase
MIFVNFKTYRQGTGDEAVELARMLKAVEEKAQVAIIPLVQAADIFRLSQQGLKVWAQHVDDITSGPNTGQVLPEAILEAGAKGALLNHSENKLPTEVIGETISKCRQLGLKTLVCAESVEEAREIVKSRPDFLAYEPPEFIGSRTTSVATGKPEVISSFIREIKGVPILVGAGIHSRKDVKTSLKLGAKGILVATDVVLADDPKKELLELAEAFKK